MRVEEQLGVHHAVGGGALEVGHRQVEEVLLAQQRGGTGVVQVEEALQVAEGVGGAGFLDAGPGQGDAVARGQGEHQLRFQGALDVQVQFGLGQGAQVGVQVHVIFPVRWMAIPSG